MTSSWVHQTAALSDFHASGGDPVAIASLVDAAFITTRFHTVEIRRPT